MRRALTIVALAAIIGLLSGCPGSEKSDSDKDTAVAKTVEKRTTIPVEVQLPIRGDISRHFETNTRVEAERKVTVTSEGTGKCMNVYVEEGDRVRAGDVLAELEKDEITAQLNSANAQLQKLKSDYARAKEMFDEGLGSEAEYDNARYAYEQQLAAVKQQEVQLNNMTIRAPISGVITVRHIQRGDLVSSGSPAFDVVDTDSYVLTINPPEQLLPRVEKGQNARVTIDAAKGDEFIAKVRRINPAVDPATGTVKVTLDFEKNVMSQLREAAFARVYLIVDTHEDALLVPKDAVVEENARKYLFVVGPQPDESPEEAAEDTASVDSDALVATRVEVQTGLENDTHVEIVDGIDDDSPVVTVGQQTLKSGSQVKLTTAEEELLAKAGLSAEEALKAAEAERARGAKTVDRRTGM